MNDLTLWLERAERIRMQRRHSKNKLYALHAPEVECTGKVKARKPYEFGVKSAVVASYQHGLMLARGPSPVTVYDGHILSANLEQATNLMQDLPVKLKHIAAAWCASIWTDWAGVSKWRSCRRTRPTSTR